MGGKLEVDVAALTAAAGAADKLAVRVDGEIGRSGLAPTLLAAEQTLAGAQSGGALSELTDAVSAVGGDLSTAARGLATGLEVAAQRYIEVDIALAASQ